jgi:hypothetical protein
MKYAGLAWVAVIAAGCTTSAIAGRPLTWEQVQRVGEVSIDDPTWNGDLLRLPIRVSQANSDSFVVLRFKGEVSENLICLTAIRELGDDKTPSKVCEAQIELPKSRLQEYFVVYKDPNGGIERLHAVQIPETLHEKLGR